MSDNDRHGATATSALAGGRRRVSLLLAIAATVLVADIISKSVVVARLTGRQPVSLLGGRGWHPEIPLRRIHAISRPRRMLAPKPVWSGNTCAPCQGAPTVGMLFSA